MRALNPSLSRSRGLGGAVCGVGLLVVGLLASAQEPAPPVAPVTNEPPASLATNAPSTAPVPKPASAEAAARPVSSPAKTPSRADFLTYKLISERNIFNANRSSRAARAANVTEAPRPVKVESFALVGTMSYQQKNLAFFDGSSTQYRKALRPADQIANHTIKEIGAHHVTLEAGGRELELRVGMQMRRQDEGEWQITRAERGSEPGRSETSRSSAASDSSANASPAAPTGGSSGSSNDLLKRLMEQRAKENNP